MRASGLVVTSSIPYRVIIFHPAIFGFSPLRDVRKVGSGLERNVCLYWCGKATEQMCKCTDKYDMT